VDVALSLSPLSVATPRPQPKLADYRDALAYLFARTTGAFKFGLERTTALLAALGNPERRYPSIHVAGTNGKGSSVATMSALLTAKGGGLKVATYTSPHLIDFRERMVVGGQMISSDEVVAFVSAHLPLIEEIGASFFEATTAMAFDHFARAGADVAVIEAGLGGRLDSTNVLHPVVAGVTSIGLDHTEYLGTTLAAIAGEKAGIFKPGRPAVIGEREPRIRDLLTEHAMRAGASVVRTTDEVGVDRVVVDASGTTCDVNWRGERMTLHTPLAGTHQADNLAFALVMLDAAGSDYAVSAAEASLHLSDVQVPGRFQQHGRFIFDVAHNPAGIEVLVRTLGAVAPPGPITALVCVLGDKDWREMLRLLSGVASRFVVTMAPTAPSSRAWSLDEAAAFARALGVDVESIPDFAAALDRAESGAGTVLVTGSFHTVGDALALLQVSPMAR
jgi:dihydrofolate synthase / folylpolyglutamate synthase